MRSVIGIEKVEKEIDVLCSGFREEFNKLLPGEGYNEAFYRLRG